jgi:hypothetical protein
VNRVAVQLHNHTDGVVKDVLSLIVVFLKCLPKVAVIATIPSLVLSLIIQLVVSIIGRR